VISEDEVQDVIGVWTDILQDIPADVAMAAARRLCRIKTDFAPTPGEIYQACMDNETNLTVYQIQQQEQQEQTLALMEYHASENVGPMPEEVERKLAAVFRKAKVKPDES